MARPDTWFRMYAEVVDDPKVQQLPDRLFRIWVNLLCVATRCGGTLPDYDDVAFKLRITPAKAKEHVETFLKRALFDETPEGVVPHNWNARQYKSDVSTERVKRFRDTKRNVSPAVSETPTEQSIAEQKKHPSDVLAKPPKRKAQISPDWMPSEKDIAHATDRSLDTKTIGNIAATFRDHHLAKQTLSADFSANWRTWVANHISYHGTGPWPRDGGKVTRGNAGGRQSVTAARDSILAKAGIRPDRDAQTLHPDSNGGGTDPHASQADSGPIIDADEWERVSGPADGNEGADPTSTGDNGRSGDATDGLPQAADGVSSGHGAACADDASGHEPLVAVVERTQGAIGDPHVSPPHDARSDGLDIPAFMRRTA